MSNNKRQYTTIYGGNFHIFIGRSLAALYNKCRINLQCITNACSLHMTINHVSTVNISRTIDHIHTHTELYCPQFALLVRPWIFSSSPLVTGLVQWDQCDGAEKYIKSSLEKDSWGNTGVPLLHHKSILPTNTTVRLFPHHFLRNVYTAFWNNAMKS